MDRVQNPSSRGFNRLGVTRIAKGGYAEQGGSQLENAAIPAPLHANIKLATASISPFLPLFPSLRRTRRKKLFPQISGQSTAPLINQHWTRYGHVSRIRLEESYDIKYFIFCIIVRLRSNRAKLFEEWM